MGYNECKRRILQHVVYGTTGEPVLAKRLGKSLPPVLQQAMPEDDRNFWSGGVNPLGARRRPRQVGSRAGQRLRFQLGPGLGESAAESPLVSSASYPFHALRASLHGRRAVVRTEPRRSPVVSRLKTPFGAKARQKKRQANATRFFG